MTFMGVQKIASYEAIDKNAKDAPRTHSFLADDGIGIVDYIFTPSTWINVPRRVALKLAAIDGFAVRDQNGNPFVVRAQHVAQTVTTLAPDEVVARYEELTDDALVARVLKMDPEALPADREEAIMMLMQGPTQPADDVIVTALDDTAT